MGAGGRAPRGAGSPLVAYDREPALLRGPDPDVPRVPARLEAGWELHGEGRVSARTWAPTWEDWATRCTSLEERPVVLAWAG